MNDVLFQENDGYIKLWRKSLRSGLMQNPILWTFWTYCLLKASHRKTKTRVGYQEVILEPGQFVFGLKAASKETGLSVQNLRTSLKYLRYTTNLTIRTTNKYSIISIVNWHIYQGTDCEDNTQGNKQLTNNQQTTNNKQECKEYKENNSILLTSDATACGRARVICPVDAILDLFHGICISLPRVASWNGTGKRSMVKRWTESKDRQSLEWWEAYFRRVESSDFLTGRKTDFVASLNWLVGPVNMEKVMNGQYDNRNGCKGAPQSKTYYHNLAAIAQAKAEIMGECDETN